MSERERQMSGPSTPELRDEGVAEEPFLRRWSRLKADSATPPADAAAPVPLPDQSADPASAAGEAEALPPGDEDMPPLESLREDSDYSGFLSPRVSAALRKQALRKLFRSPKFNVISQLDDYIDDYRNYPALGDIVTADMKHAAARFLEKQLKEAETADAVAAAEADAQADADAVAAAGAVPSNEPLTTDAETRAADDAEEPTRDA